MKRIIELDYIRGIAILMVVMGHVLLFSLKIEHTALLSFISICEMPLFFAVSGYLSHKDRVEDFKGMLHRLLIRSRGLLVPLFVWSAIRNICDGTITCSLSMVYRGGYWFFLVLWWCDLLNTFIAYISHKYKFKLCYDILFYGIVYVIIILLRIANFDLFGILPIQNVQYYFPFFIIGLFIHKYSIIHKVMLNKFSYAVGLLLFMIGWYFSYIESFIIWFMAAVGALIVVWMFCKEINPDNKAARLLSIIGMNTLPIYAIHYLFICVCPTNIYDMVSIPNGFFFQLIVSLVYAVLAIIVCLLVDRILSLSPITRMLFFGESKRREWHF